MKLLLRNIQQLVVGFFNFVNKKKKKNKVITQLTLTLVLFGALHDIWNTTVGSYLGR